MKHVVIITGGHLNIDFAKAYLKTLSYDKVFAVDKGLEYADALGIIPDYLVGDFDTVNTELLGKYETMIEKGTIATVVERHPAMKDATDTELALDIAMSEGADHVTLLAATGSRVDHLLANVGLLTKTSKQHIQMYIVDDCNRICMISSDNVMKHSIVQSEQFGKYISLIPVTPFVAGVTLKGALYPLENETIYQGESRTVSNEILEECIEISLKSGKLLLIESKDK